MVLPILSPNTCPTLEAGAVLTSRTFFPALARGTAVAHAMEVLPTPPLPVKKRNRGALSRNFMSPPFSATTGGLGAGGFGAAAVGLGARRAGRARAAAICFGAGGGGTAALCPRAGAAAVCFGAGGAGTRGR